MEQSWEINFLLGREVMHCFLRNRSFIIVLTTAEHCSLYESRATWVRFLARSQSSCGKQLLASSCPSVHPSVRLKRCDSFTPNGFSYIFIFQNLNNILFPVWAQIGCIQLCISTYKHSHYLAIILLYNWGTVPCKVRTESEETADDRNITTEYGRH
jgi:hypothetical protein